EWSRSHQQHLQGRCRAACFKERQPPQQNGAPIQPEGAPGNTQTHRGGAYCQLLKYGNRSAVATISFFASSNSNVESQRPSRNCWRTPSGSSPFTVTAPQRISELRTSTSTFRLGSSSTAAINRAISPSETVRHGIPSATQLPKKISANDSPTIALIPFPQRMIACGACSRLEPHPKFLFTNNTSAPA